MIRRAAWAVLSAIFVCAIMRAEGHELRVDIAAHSFDYEAIAPLAEMRGTKDILIVNPAINEDMRRGRRSLGGYVVVNFYGSTPFGSLRSQEHRAGWPFVGVLEIGGDGEVIEVLPSDFNFAVSGGRSSAVPPLWSDYKILQMPVTNIQSPSRIKFVQEYESPFSDAQRAIGRAQSPSQNECLNAQNSELENGNDNEPQSVFGQLAVKIDKLPVQFLFLGSLLIFPLGVVLIFLGGYHFDDKRRLLSAALIVGGSLLGLGWLLLWALPVLARV